MSGRDPFVIGFRLRLTANGIRGWLSNAKCAYQLTLCVADNLPILALNDDTNVRCNCF